MTPQPLYDFGGAGPVIHLAVANGFPPETYRPVMQPLTQHYHVVSLPPRPLWTPPPPPSSIDNWQSLADDMRAGMADYDLGPVIAIGHSYGGVASMLAAIDEPARFRAIIMLDPTMLPPAYLKQAAAANAAGTPLRGPLIEGAERRRNKFSSVQEGFEYWVSKPLFKDWPESSVLTYAESMLHPTADGSYELRWSPQWEAQYYRTLYTETWEKLPLVNGLLPILIVRGTTSTTFQDEAARIARQVLPEADYSEIEGHGHLFPHSAPEQTLALIQSWLAKHGF